jgi:hypothetical protein
MPHRRIPVGRIAALAALAVGAYAVTQGGGGIRWRTVASGIEFATIRGEPYCRRGSSAVAVLRLDPRRVRIRALHFTRQPEREPLTIVDWQRRTGAVAVFNAGQYYPDLSYMGLFVSNGDVVSRRLHPGFRAALVASPASSSGAAARVLDLERDPLDPRRPGWRDVAQSFMLFDRDGRERIRRSDHVANRTVVAEDRRGRIVVTTSEGGYTLWDFAKMLRESPLELSHAMSMDGGFEAELCVTARGFHYASFGRWGGPSAETSSPGADVPLPAVIAVHPRESAP